MSRSASLQRGTAVGKQVPKAVAASLRRPCACDVFTRMANVRLEVGTSLTNAALNEAALTTLEAAHGVAAARG